LPELSEPEVIRHYIRLSQETYGVDSGISLGVGTCTMKYSPKVNESLVRSTKLTDIHPLQDEGTVQGILEVMFRLGEFLCEISGMDEFSLQPRAGAHAVLTNARIMKAYHKSLGESEQRNEIITTILSHPCNGAAPAVAGFKVLTLYPDETGIPDVEALKAIVSKHTAGLMFTCPYDTGVFDPNIDTYFKIVHEAGGLVAIDQANANGVLGRLRIGDVGADLCQFNLHKTFSTPHASSGPGSAPIGVKKHLAKFLPVPTVEFDGKQYHLNYDRPHSIGKVAGFYGVLPNIVRAYAWILSMGAKGLEETSEVAIINNNYLIKKLLEVRGVTLPWVKNHPRRLQEARFSLEKMKQDTGIGIDEVNCRIVDYGIQRCFTSHLPWTTPEPFTPEPTESTPKEDIDKFVEVFIRISDEAYSNPEVLKNAPLNCSIAKVDATPSNDPEKWALTWRAYVKKHQ
jgi:glycine dehydrogenase subunit 2